MGPNPLFGTRFGACHAALAHAAVVRSTGPPHETADAWPNPSEDEWGGVVVGGWVSGEVGWVGPFPPPRENELPFALFCSELVGVNLLLHLHRLILRICIVRYVIEPKKASGLGKSDFPPASGIIGEDQQTFLLQCLRGSWLLPFGRQLGLVFLIESWRE